MDYQQVIETLEWYSRYDRLIKQLKDAIDDCLTSATSKSEVIGSSSEISSQPATDAEKREHLCDKLKQIEIEAAECKLTCCRWIASLENVNQQIVLIYKYVHGYKWEEAENIIGQSERHLRRIRNKAIKEIINKNT